MSEIQVKQKNYTKNVEKPNYSKIAVMNLLVNAKDELNLKIRNFQKEKQRSYEDPRNVVRFSPLLCPLSWSRKRVQNCATDGRNTSAQMRKVR